MVDLLSLTLAVAALITGGVAILGLWIQHGQLRAAKAQLAAAGEQLKAEAAKVDALGKLVEALRGLVGAQTRQLEAFRESLRLQAESNEIARRDAAVRAAQFELERANPIDKVVSAVKEVVDRGKERGKRFLRRLFRQH